jgi:DNA-binding XRE family transcriptional regulator
MKLSKYLKRNDISPIKMAKVIGLAHTTIYNLFKGRDVKLSIAVKICTYCEGEVTPEEIYAEFIEKSLESKK